MKYYKSKSGYKYREYKSGKKVRISDNDYHKNVNKLNKKKGGSNQPLNNQILKDETELIRNLVSLKKIINKIKERLKKPLKNNKTHGNRRLAVGKTNHNRLRTSRTPQTIPNMLEMLGQFSNPQAILLNTLFTDALKSIIKIKEISGLTNTKIFLNKLSDNDKLDKLREFYNGIIDKKFPQIKKNNFNHATIATALPRVQKAFSTGLAETSSKVNIISKYGPVELWDVSKITTMTHLLYGLTLFNEDIGGWDVSNVTDMSNMFDSASSFNADISKWDVSNVKDMSVMFYRAHSFNADISKWDVSNVTNMQQMFLNCNKFNADIGGWDVSSVTNMAYMFNSASSFNKPIDNWVIHQNTSLDKMFNTAISMRFYIKTVGYPIYIMKNFIKELLENFNITIKVLSPPSLLDEPALLHWSFSFKEEKKGLISIFMQRLGSEDGTYYPEFKISNYNLGSFSLDVIKKRTFRKGNLKKKIKIIGKECDNFEQDIEIFYKYLLYVKTYNDLIKEEKLKKNEPFNRVHRKIINRLQTLNNNTRNIEGIELENLSNMSKGPNYKANTKVLPMILSEQNLSSNRGGKRLLRTGPKGGKYYMKGGNKVYIN